MKTRYRNAFEVNDPENQLNRRQRRGFLALCWQAKRDTAEVGTEKAYLARVRELVELKGGEAERYGISVALIVLLIKIAMAIFVFLCSESPDNPELGFDLEDDSEDPVDE